MPKRSSTKPKGDLNTNAFNLVAKATTEKPQAPSPAKNPAAVALGRLGGIKGGKARAESLSAGARRSIAQAAARARWKKRKP